MDIPACKCIDCDHRSADCHADCKEYKDFKEQYEVYKAWLRDQGRTQWLTAARPWLREKYKKGGEV